MCLNWLGAGPSGRVGLPDGGGQPNEGEVVLDSFTLAFWQAHLTRILMLKRLLHASIAVATLAFAWVGLAQPLNAEPGPTFGGEISVSKGRASPGSAGIADIVVGENHACVLLNTGEVKCWGHNGYGQLGDGTNTNRTTATQVVQLGIVVAIAAGNWHTCAIEIDGAVKCWGYNHSGQLGDGSRTNRSLPLRVSSLGGPATAVSAGGNRTCAILSSGILRCWGSNYQYEVGTGSNVPDTILTPVTVSVVVGNVTQVAMGGGHTCVLIDTGGVRCWGYNVNGELGLGVVGNPIPQSQSPVGLSSGVVRLAAWNGSTCALLDSGDLRCWGPNGSGQVGNGSPSDYRNTPTQVISLTKTILDFSVSSWQGCAVTNERLLCWGSVGADRTGNGQTEPPVLVPAPVWGLFSGVTRVVTTGGDTTCVMVDGGVMCWGTNDSGEIGDGTTTRRLRPVAVVGLEPNNMAGQCLTEGFDAVPPAGWSVKNNSDPVGMANWFLGNTGYFTAQAGALKSYAAANVDSTGFFGTISDWLISPVISLTNDSRVAIWTRKAIPDFFPDRMQVRLSQAGYSTDVGVTAESVGDFTTLLYDINPGLVTNTYPIAWYPLTLTVRGITGTVSGRVAFRYYVADGGPGGLNSDYIGVDSFTHCIPAAALPATATPTPTANSTATPTPTSTATSTPTPTATAVPAPTYFAFVPKVLR